MPIGGGGLCSWHGDLGQAREADDAASTACRRRCARRCAHALRGEKLPVLHTHTLADGIAVKNPGVITRRS
jgi:threonine dehydratase